VDSGRLEQERAAVTTQIADLERDLADIVASAELVATDDEHDPEGATIAFERARVTALLEHARKVLTAIDHAEQRMAAGGYGTCERCGGPIPAERLEARPATTICINCAARS
jgi:RNA polymerase-binding protein DksA